MSTGMRTAIAWSVLAVLAFGGATALAGGAATPPSIDDVVGQYAMSFKYASYDYANQYSWKGSSVGGFVVTKTGPTEVHLLWTDANGTTMWEYEAHYLSGMLIIGTGDSGASPAPWMEGLYVEITGSPGKLKMKGKYYYELAGSCVDVETVAGKWISAP